jgi:hypothetical protein
VGLGYKFILKYLHNKYQLVRTSGNVFSIDLLLSLKLEKIKPEKAYFAKDLKNMAS